jgi:hypothetical protein
MQNVYRYYMPDSLKQLVLEKIRKPPDEREADEVGLYRLNQVDP